MSERRSVEMLCFVILFAFVAACFMSSWWAGLCAIGAVMTQNAWTYYKSEYDRWY